VDGINFTTYTSKCQGESNTVETQAIERYRPRLIVWGSTDERSSIVVHTPTGSKVIDSGSPAWKSVMSERVNDRVEQFLATGAKVILLLEPPSVHGGQRNSDDLAYAHMNALLREIAARHPRDVGVVNLEARVCPSGPPCQYFVDGHGSISDPDQAIRPDAVHYLPPGSLWVARWLVPQIAAAAKNLQS
jgi:hypothetical protein